MATCWLPSWWLTHSFCPPPPPPPPTLPSYPAVQWLGINGGFETDYTDSLNRTWHPSNEPWESGTWGGWYGSSPRSYSNNWGSPRFKCVNWPPEYDQDYDSLLHAYSDSAEQNFRVNLQSEDAPVEYYTVKYVFCEKTHYGGAKMDFYINGRLVKRDYTSKKHHTHTDIYSWQCVPTVDGMIEFRIVGKDWSGASKQRVQARFSTLEFNRSAEGCGQCTGVDCNMGTCISTEFYDSTSTDGRGAEGKPNKYEDEQPSFEGGKCSCSEGISGDSCEAGPCANVDCNEPFGGICDSGACTCTDGHSGPDCRTRPNTDEFGCYPESKSPTERLTVSRVCLPERIAGVAKNGNLFRGPSPMHLVADNQDQDVAYFSWTADRDWGRAADMGDEGRIYVSKLRFPRGQVPTLLHSTAFDGFVRAGGIDATDTGTVGTLCAKYWPPWVDYFTKVMNKKLDYAPMALAVCEVATATMARAGTPWRIGKQFLPTDTALPSTGGWGNYPLTAWFAQRSAGYGWLTYATKSRSWSAWYGATVGGHTGFAMHTYQADAPRVSASTFDQYVDPVPADKIEARVENLTGPFSDHHRVGSGDHQAGAAWRYHPLIGDIALMKYTHWEVYMQQYGLEHPSGNFSPPGHKTGRVTVAHGGDEAIQEGGIRPCGDGWIAGIVSKKGNVCAKVTRDGAFTAWRVIDPSVGAMPCSTKGQKCGDGIKGRMVRIAPLGSPEEQALCGHGARFLFGYETADRRRWLVELDGDCNEITTKADVTLHTTWPLYQDWATTAGGDVVWVTSWSIDDEGKFGPKGSPNSVHGYPKKPQDADQMNSGGHLFGRTPSATNHAWLTVYRSAGPN